MGEAQAPPPLFVAFDGKLPRDIARRVERVRAMPGVAAMALLPDAHLAGDFCVGLAIATDDVVYPEAVGSDIGCGMATVRLGLPAAPLTIPRLRRALARIAEVVPAHRHAARRELPLDPAALSAPPLARVAERDGAVQFATLGRGNHFLELQADHEGRAWLTVHTGSRAMGAAVTDHHSRAAPSFRASSPEGAAYLNDVAWCRAYARASRQAILARAGALLQDLLQLAPPDADDLPLAISSDHNHVQPETHMGRTLQVHRKGVTPAGEGEYGIIAGSMATRTLITRGRGHPPSLASSSHGAGRRLTRAEARRQLGVANLRRLLAEVVHDDRLGQALLEESPEAYRDLGRVMRAQRDLTRTVLTLRPLLAHKAP